MYDKINYNPNGGYVALITALLLSASLLIIVVAVSFEGYFSRFTVLESELKEEATYLAVACANYTIYYLAEDPSYDTAESKTVGDKTCEIVSVTTSGSDRTIQAKGVSGDAHTNLEVEVDVGSAPLVTITSWEEVPHF